MTWASAFATVGVAFATALVFFVIAWGGRR